MGDNFENVESTETILTNAEEISKMSEKLAENTDNPKQGCSEDKGKIQEEKSEDFSIEEITKCANEEKAAKPDNKEEEKMDTTDCLKDEAVSKQSNVAKKANLELMEVDDKSNDDDLNNTDVTLQIEGKKVEIEPQISGEIPIKSSDENIPINEENDGKSEGEIPSKILESTENDKETNESQNKHSSEGSSKRKLSDDPEDILNLLKNLSPEKLLEIKSKVLAITENIEPSSSDESKNLKESASIDKEQKSENTEESHPLNEKEQQNEITENTNTDVICLDSDDDNDSTDDKSLKPDNDNAISEQKNENAEEQKETETQQEEIKGDDNSNHSNLNGDASRLNLKECINPKCPRNKDDEYLESPSFVLSMYYIASKPNKIQWVCKTCHDEAIETYEKLCSKFMSNEPWIGVKIPKKQDLVEIIDSDDEDEASEKAIRDKQNGDSNMIIFNAEVENEIEEILTNLTSKVDIKMQLDEEYKHIESKVNRNAKVLADIDEELKVLERKSYKMYDELYSFNRPKIQRRPSLSLDIELAAQPDSCSTQNSLAKSTHSMEKSVPEVSILPVTRATSNLVKAVPTSTQMELEFNDKICYAVRQKGIQMPHWMACRIIEEISSQDGGKKFKVQFCDNMPNSLTIVSGREISVHSSSENLVIGARVIALFPRSVTRNSNNKNQTPLPLKRYLPGVIGEKLTQYNKRRYLVFCDYGQVRYCTPNEVREIQESSENVWEDVHPNLRQFIRDYLESKTNRSRALLNVRVNTQILTERSGNWRKTVVQEIDCSLVKVYFTAENVSEWLYRGSKRLYTMYQQTQRVQGNAFQRRNDTGAFSYITIDDDEGGVESTESAEAAAKRNIAKKSTSKPAIQQLQVQQTAQPATAQPPIILNDRNIYLEEPAVVGKVRHFTPKAGICAKKFVTHECTESCLPTLKNDLSSFSPLSKPLLSCWERQIVRQRNYRYVVYKAPCGRRLRNMHEVFIYLGLTKCTLNVENFDFDPSIQVLASFHVDKSLCPLYIDDIAEGKEGMKIACINAFDQQRPPPLEYSAKRIPMNGVNINLDPEFMSCCDCTDECVDKSKCACFQLTIRGAKYRNVMEEDEENISYLWKRLLSTVPTGIYECNSRCKCSDRCLNKVVQHPVRSKLQLYRTKARGWGLQSLHDIPKGTFISIYAGNLYTEKDANALCQGLDHGDEYFAELDLIENAENRKEGYESGVINPDESDEEKDSDSDYDDKNDSHDYDDGDFISKTKATGQREIVTRSSRNSTAADDKNKKTSASSTPQRTNSEDSDDEMVSMIPSAASTVDYPEGVRIPFRKLYGPKERVYIMDAKQCGNVGRYFNHSCDPNLFVQSVFVDTHDLRFPWIAFFAQRPIKAGEELTWNYAYEVGSVPSKVLYCKCGSKNCRGRIL